MTSAATIRRRAFTLLEVLLAISVGAMLLISVVGLAFSMSELWGNTSEPRLFAQHVRGVSRFLDNLLRQAEPPPEITSAVGDAQSAQQQQQEQQQPPPGQPGAAPSPTQTASAAGEPPVVWQNPRGRKYGSDEFLTFELAESPGIFAWPEEPLPFVVCALRVDPNDGLFLLWKSRLEEDFEEEAPREFRLSPYVTGITYYYHDTSGAQPKWEKSEQARRTGGEQELPARIELTFEYKNDKIDHRARAPDRGAGGAGVLTMKRPHRHVFTLGTHGRGVRLTGSAPLAERRDGSLGERSATRPRRHQRRGSIILLILVMIFVLSILIVQFTEKAMTEIAVEGHYADRERLRVTAYSALETTLAVLADVIAIDSTLTSPAQGWGDPLATAAFDPGSDTKVTVTFSDESGKLPLSDVDDVTLGLMFTRMGYDRDESQHLTETLLDWIDSDDETRLDGAESDFYGEKEWPYHASNQPVRRLSELALVDGFKELFFDETGRPNEAFRAFSSAVSLHGRGSLNANSANELALRSAAMFGDQQVDILRDYLAGPDSISGTDDDRFFSSDAEIAGLFGQLPEGTSLTAGISVLRIHVEVEFGLSRFALEAVVQPGQSGAGGGAGNRSEVGQGPPAGDAPVRSEGEQRAAISYPFVFLELTEDVGHNATIASSVDESATASSIPSALRP